LRIDLLHKSVTRAGARVDLSPKEMGILEALFLARGEPVSREKLLTSVWHYDYAPDSRTVDNYVMLLRRKLEANSLEPVLVLTVRGAGYRLNIDVLRPIPSAPGSAV
jgi:DNA-binding response OmpR family regulator